MRIKRILTSSRTTEKADPQANSPRMRTDRNDPQLGGHDPFGLPSIGLRLEADQHLRMGVPVGLQHGAPLSCNIRPKGGEARPPVLNHHLFGKLLAEAVGPAALEDDSSDDKLLRRRIVLVLIAEVKLQELWLRGCSRRDESHGTPGTAPRLIVEAAVVCAHRLLVGGAGA